jgi:ABC-type sugar transport system ATPase subunit
MGNGISLLRVEKIVKQFPGTLALNELDFDARRGEVHAVVGLIMWKMHESMGSQ